MTSLPAHAPLAPLEPEDFDRLDDLLDALRQHDDEVPQWEFCEGFMAALVCCRRAVPPDEYLPMLIDAAPLPPEFLSLWQRRWQEVERGLDAKVNSLSDEGAYHPEVMDVRGAVASLSQAERDEMAGDALPSFAQVWALGFMFAVENWPEEWAPPRDRAAAKALDESLQAMVALTEDDTDVPTLSVFNDDGPPSVSERRFNAFADAVWAVYDLRALWRSFGPRVQAVRKAQAPGRNDPCACGSGKKYKKCCGA